jgi:hypothetical protein
VKLREEITRLRDVYVSADSREEAEDEACGYRAFLDPKTILGPQYEPTIEEEINTCEADEIVMHIIRNGG